MTSDHAEKHTKYDSDPFVFRSPIHRMGVGIHVGVSVGVRVVDDDGRHLLLWVILPLLYWLLVNGLRGLLVNWLLIWILRYRLVRHLILNRLLGFGLLCVSECRAVASPGAIISFILNSTFFALFHITTPFDQILAHRHAYFN